MTSRSRRTWRQHSIRTDGAGWPACRPISCFRPNSPVSEAMQQPGSVRNEHGVLAASILHRPADGVVTLSQLGLGGRVGTVPPEDQHVRLPVHPAADLAVVENALL